MKKLLLILFICPSVIFAQIPKPQPGTYVNDNAGVLSSAQIEQLNKQALALEKATSVQIAIVLVNELPANMEIEDFAREIGRTWHVGNANNGLVYVAAFNTHKQRLEVAKELEGAIPDIEALHITDGIKPFFRQKDFFGGLFYMLQQVQAKIKPEAAEQKKLGENELDKKNDSSMPGWDIALIVIGVFAGLIGVVWLFTYLFGDEDEPEEDTTDELKRTKFTPASTYQSSGVGSSGIGSNIASGLVGYELGRMSQRNDDEDRSSRRSYSDDNSSSSGSSSDDSDSSSSSDDSSSYGSWGSGSSDSGSSSDSGFSGGGSSNDW